MAQLTLRVYTCDASGILAAFAQPNKPQQESWIPIEDVGAASIQSQRCAPGMTGDEVMLTIVINLATNISTGALFYWIDKSLLNRGKNSAEFLGSRTRCYTRAQVEEALSDFLRERFGETD